MSCLKGSFLKSGKLPKKPTYCPILEHLLVLTDHRPLRVLGPFELHETEAIVVDVHAEYGAILLKASLQIHTFERLRIDVTFWRTERERMRVGRCATLSRSF